MIRRYLSRRRAALERARKARLGMASDMRRIRAIQIKNPDRLILCRSAR